MHLAVPNSDGLVLVATVLATVTHHLLIEAKERMEDRNGLANPAPVVFGVVSMVQAWRQGLASEFAIIAYSILSLV